VAPINAALSSSGLPYTQQCSAWINHGNQEGFKSSDGASQPVALAFDDTIDSDILAVSKLDNPSNSTGVQVYYLNKGMWQKQGPFINGGSSSEDSSYSMALSSNGNKIAFADSTYENKGRVRIYELGDDNLWKQLDGDIIGATDNENLGYSLDLSSDGNILATGSYRCDRNGRTTSGCVNVYRYTDILGWTKEDVFKGESSDDKAGYSISLSSDGTSLAFNANGVFVYEYKAITNSWDQKGENLDPSRSLTSLVQMSSDGSIIAIGNEKNQKVFTSFFNSITGNWNQRGDDISFDISDSSKFSLTMSANGNRLAIGADTVQVYTIDETGNWTKCSDASIKTGYPVVMSQDGNKIAFGENSNGNEVVKVYETGPKISIKDAWKLIPSETPFTSDRFEVALHYDISREKSKDDVEVQLMLKNCKKSMQIQSGFDLDVKKETDKLIVTYTINDTIALSNKIVYKEPNSDGIAIIEFCVQTSLKSRSNVAVARRQANIYLSLDTVANFTIKDFDVEAVEIDEYDAGIIRYNVTAAIISTGSGAAPANKYKQGDIVTIEVEAKGGPVEIESIDSFTFQKTNDNDCFQTIKNNMEKELTIFEHSQDKSKCTFSTLLKACFYYSGGVVSASGTTTLKFREDRRRLIVGQPQLHNNHGYRQLVQESVVNNNEHIHADINTWFEVGGAEAKESLAVNTSWIFLNPIILGWILLLWM